MFFQIGHFTLSQLLGPLKRVSILHVSANGEVIDSIHSTSGKFDSISEAHIFKDTLYMGTPFNDYIVKVPLSKIGWTHLGKVEQKPTTPKPTTTTQKPTTTTQKPTTTTQKPTTTTQKPTTTTQKPATTTQKPTTTTPKPTTTTQKPTTTTQKPTTTTQKPTTTTPKPTTQKTAPPTQKPAAKQATNQQQAPPPKAAQPSKPSN